MVTTTAAIVLIGPDKTVGNTRHPIFLERKKFQSFDLLEKQKCYLQPWNIKQIILKYQLGKYGNDKVRKGQNENVSCCSSWEKNSLVLFNVSICNLQKVIKKEKKRKKNS